jgi:hypothetical protein
MRLTQDNITSEEYDPGEGVWYVRFANYPRLTRMTTFERSLLRTGLDW